MRHYAFMLQGLKDVKRALHKREIQFAVQHLPERAATVLAKEASLAVTDMGRQPDLWKTTIYKRFRIGA